jgi:gliding motility-associated lipoprotein GldH
MKSLLSCLLIIIVVTVSCRQINLYEYNTAVPRHQWKRNFAVSGKFIISDTSAPYNIYLVLRHLDSYNYNNIWLNVGLAAPGDSLYFQRLNVTLGNDATGWEGSGMNDIWEVRKLLNGRSQRFVKPGEYRFQINHIMRDDPLSGFLSAGMRIEKAQ